MRVALGGLLGIAVGLGAWLAAAAFAPGAERHGPDPDPAQRTFRLRSWIGRSSWQAVLAGGAMGLWGAYAGWRAASWPLLILALPFTGVLLALSVVDFRARRLPNLLLVVLAGWSLAQVLWLGQPTPLAAAVGLGAGGAFFALLAIIGRGAMGAGDVKLAAVLGACLGFPPVLEGLLWGTVAGAGAALWLLATRRAGRKDPMAYGPYLALGAWLVWTRMQGLWP